MTAKFRQINHKFLCIESPLLLGTAGNPKLVHFSLTEKILESNYFLDPYFTKSLKNKSNYKWQHIFILFYHLHDHDFSSNSSLDHGSSLIGSEYCWRPFFCSIESVWRIFLCPAACPALCIILCILRMAIHNINHYHCPSRNSCHHPGTAQRCSRQPHTALLHSQPVFSPIFTMGNFCYQSQSDKLQWIGSNSESQTKWEFGNVKRVHERRD